jgi:hypothetical protein
VSTERIAQLKEATKNDNELCALKQIIKTGWPESKEDVPKPIHRNGSSPEFSDFFIILFTVLTAFSAFPFDWGYPGELVTCTNS